QPLAELALQVLPPPLRRQAAVLDRLPEAQPEPAEGVVRAVLLLEADRPAGAAGEAERLLEDEGGGAVHVPGLRALDRPAGLRVAVDGRRSREAILGEVRPGAG